MVARLVLAVLGMKTNCLLAAALLTLATLPAGADGLLGVSSSPASMGSSRTAHPPAIRRLEYSPEMLAIYRRYIDAAALNDASHPRYRAELDRMVSEGKCIFESALAATQEFILANGEKETNRGLSSVDHKRMIVRAAEARREIRRLANDPQRALPIAACHDGVVEWTGKRWDHQESSPTISGQEAADGAAIDVYRHQYDRAIARGQRRAATEAAARAELAQLLAQYQRSTGRQGEILFIRIELVNAEITAWTGTRAD